MAKKPKQPTTSDTAVPPGSDDPQEPAFVPPEQIAEQSAASESTQAVVKPQPSWRQKLKHLPAAYWARRKWTVPVTVLLLVLVVFVVPASRYSVLGLFLKGQVSVTVLDSKTNTPVTDAVVRVGGSTFKTNAAGKASGSVRLGATDLNVSKQYYKDAAQSAMVTLSAEKNTYKISLVATGRQVPVAVVNKITGKPLAGAVVRVLNTDAKTDKNGKATIVLPATAASQKAVVELAGYNKLATTVLVTEKPAAANLFAMTPAGKLYFLSNQSGKIDVVKSNLDGTDRQTVLAGTGNEEPTTTSLLASRDWKYLALLSRRAGTNASVYLINTTTDKLTTIDEGNATFSLHGWSDDRFVYQVGRLGVETWQPKAQALKSYHAPTGKITTLDETTAEGTASWDYAYNNFSGVYLLDDEIVYAKNWLGGYYANRLAGKSVTMVSVKPDGTAKKTIKDFPVPAGETYYFVTLKLYAPGEIYAQVPTGTSSTYYEYEDGKIEQKPGVTSAVFDKNYATYLESPAGTQTFWGDERDGKNVLFVGDKAGKNEKQIAALSEYVPYGWYSDDYLLVSKDSSELYILPSDGSKPPTKITDYYKPAFSYDGYGGGYGGF
jgi:hypothetical protein